MGEVKLNARIIVIEGTDCSGKEEQSKKLYEKLLSEGYKVKLYDFPDYDLPTGQIVGKHYLGKDFESYFPEKAPNVDPFNSITYFAQNRRESFLKRDIEEQLSKNHFVIFDRYVTSNYGHQGGKGKTLELKLYIVDFINNLEFGLMELPKPDLVIFLHMPYKASQDLKKNRETLDDLEKSESHLKDAEEFYLYLVKKYGWKYIDSLKVPGVYNSLEDLKTISDISEEVFKEAINSLEISAPVRKRITRFI